MELYLDNVDANLEILSCTNCRPGLFLCEYEYKEVKNMVLHLQSVILDTTKWRCCILLEML